MRNFNRSLIVTGLAAGALAVGVTACQSGGGDVNAHNITVTVNVPKTVVTSAAGVGVVYVGIWSGVDNHLGFPSPVAAPAASSAGADTFPFGGTSVGDFSTRDARMICLAVTDQAVIDKTDHWEVDGQILQFPWIKGQVVWAFADRSRRTCDPGNGFGDNYGIPITLTSISSTNGQATSPTPLWRLTFAATPMFDAGGTPYFPPAAASKAQIDGGSEPGALQILDGAGHVFAVWREPDGAGGKQAADLQANNFVVVVQTPVGTSLVPKLSGPAQPRLEKDNPDGSDFTTYGTQFQDILNFPGKYIQSGDLVVSNAATLNAPNDVTISLDTVVP